MPSKPFFLFIIDDDRKAFNVIGPLTDDRLWLATLLEQKWAGRTVRMFHTPIDKQREHMAADYAKQMAYTFCENSIV